MGKYKIVIVEDEDDIRELVIYHLEQNGFEVKECSNYRANKAIIVAYRLPYKRPVGSLRRTPTSSFKVQTTTLRCEVPPIL